MIQNNVTVSKLYTKPQYHGSVHVSLTQLLLVFGTEPPGAR